MSTKPTLKIVERDEWLAPVEDVINRRYDNYQTMLNRLTGGTGRLTDVANMHKYLGWHYDSTLKGWWFREWLPKAMDAYLFGDFNNWQRTELRMSKGDDGVWSIFLPDAMYDYRLTHGSLYKIHVHGMNGWYDRIPAYATRVVQDDTTKNFTAQFWIPQEFDWKGDAFDMSSLGSLLIYESHVGMAQEKEGVGTFREFIDTVLPRVKKAGYNTIQLMAVAEHPYYGSFGYHVANFFAVSSRFGTPEELKELIRTAHSMGIGVVMDLVHAHFVKNFDEGLNELDGSPYHYSKQGDAGYQQYWDSRVFDYGKWEVMQFLLSNIKYWLEEFHFDGFRFDGVTSMVYKHRGYTEFDCREKFFNEGVDEEALCYLTLANKLTHEIRPDAVTIAEDVSGMPGMVCPIDEGGVGFDYRLGMAIPDFWIKMLKDQTDDEWNIWEMWELLTNRLPGVKTVAYAESHDHSMVGDQTIAFRLMDKEMYTAMDINSESMIIDRGMALHKMIRLITLTAGGDAYLNFMGNEFGHPEWIDFPREGNNWSYKHARRQWSLAEDKNLRFGMLEAWDRAMIALEKEYDLLADGYPYRLQMDEGDKTIVFSHRNLVFVFNWHPTKSTNDYIIKVREPGKYRLILSTDDPEFGGYGRMDHTAEHFTFPGEGEDEHFMQVYNVCRTACVYKKIEE